MSWINRNTLLIYTSEGFEYNPSVAAFGFLHTLVKDYYNAKTWSLSDSKILTKFNKINQSGASIVFFSNQPLSFHVNTIKARFNRFMDDFNEPDEIEYDVEEDPDNLVDDSDQTGGGLESAHKQIPVMAIFATKNNCFRKPYTNMWKVLGFMYVKQKLDPPCLKTSIYVGKLDGGTYLKNWKEKRDGKTTENIYDNKTVGDRAFAFNIGIQFFSYRLFFHGIPEAHWQWNKYFLSIDRRMEYMKKTKHVKEPDIAQILGEMKCENPLIIVMGRPSSGKHVLIKRIAEDFDENKKYTIINSADLNFRKKHTKAFKKVITDALFEGTVFFCTHHANYFTRNYFIKEARKYEKKTLVVYLSTPTNICKILNFTKVQTSTNFELASHHSLDYVEWDKKFEYPHYDDEEDVTSVEYPMVLQFRKELKYQYT